eukprot:c15758_g1_i1.p1 GENE.c15758_g1_i1~~c15758_g1_i1.p1  ORF type:complete len:219 (+),score=83.91 c15758_g1_i1:44-700(+)
MKAVSIKGCIGILFFCSIGLFISSCFSARQCYTIPCHQGSGLDMLWSVHDGQGFQLVVTSMVVIAHSFAAYGVLFKSPASEIKYGILVAVTATLAFIMLLQGAVWGVKTTMISDLSNNNGTGVFYQIVDNECVTNTSSRSSDPVLECENDKNCKWYHEKCQRILKIDPQATADFTAVTAFSFLLFGFQALLSTFLLCWKADLGISTTTRRREQFTGDA